MLETCPDSARSFRQRVFVSDTIGFLFVSCPLYPFGNALDQSRKSSVCTDRQVQNLASESVPCVFLQTDSLRSASFPDTFTAPCHCFNRPVFVKVEIGIIESDLMSAWGAAFVVTGKVQEDVGGQISY